MKIYTGSSHFRIILNVLIIICSIGAWLVMVFARGGMLTDTGLRSLKYFTVLSNLFEGIASVVWIYAVCRHDENRDARISKAERRKYLAAVLAGALIRRVNNYYERAAYGNTGGEQ